MTVYKRFDDVPLFRYDLIMADPNWLYENWSEAGNEKNAAQQYHCDPVDVIKKHRVGDMAAPDCLLWLWATNPMLPQAFEVLAAWGFRFVTAGHWVKTTKNQAMNWGPGYTLRTLGEPYLLAVKESGEIAEGSPFLIGKIGKPVVVPKDTPSVILGEAREHSRKPESAYRYCEKMIPDARRLDLFSRAPRAGWDVAGDEADKYEEIA